MPVYYVEGDPLLTKAQVLAVGHNARGRTEVDPLHTALQAKYPAAFATYARRCANAKIKTGTLWMWHDSRPQLGFMVVRESNVSATRLRYLEAVALTLARDHALEGIKSVAMVAPGSALEWTALKEVIQRWLAPSSLPVIVYEKYVAGVMAE